MVLGDRFTYIHEPKTGGTFVTHVLSRLHGGLIDVPASRLRAPALRLGLPSLAFHPERLRATRHAENSAQAAYGPIYNWNDHGTCSEIPIPHRSRTILATVRNPLQTYVSMFRFGWWKRPEYVPAYERTVPDFRDRYREFPDVSFRQYLELLHAGCPLPGTRDLDNETGIGYLTERFVRFYFRLPRRFGVRPDAERVLSNLDGYVEGGRVRDEMFDIHFIRTSRLNRELFDFLRTAGYEVDDLAFVENLQRIVPVGGARAQVVEREGCDWRQLYSAELEELVRKRERLIFSLFPDLDGYAETSA
jgi:hypothetical protein